MTNKQKIEALRSYIDLAKELDDLMETYWTIRLKLESAKIPHLTKDKVQTSLVDRQTEDMAEMIDLQNCIEARRIDISKAQTGVRVSIETVRNKCLRAILTARYLKGWTWGRIANDTKKHKRQIHYLHRLAVNKITLDLSLLDMI
jgi:hypothetical protein